MCHVISNYPSKEELDEIFELRGCELWRKAYVDASGRKREERLVRNKVNTTQGYCYVSFKGRVVKYHAIIYILYHGGVKNGCIIDHLDGNPINNNIENLMAKTNRENSQNQRMHREGRLGGCCFHKREKKWTAYIQKKEKLISLGNYPSELEAHQIYLKALELIDFYVNPKSFRDLINTELGDLKLVY